MMDRADLEVPLKLALNKLDGQIEPDREVIKDAIKELKIDPEQLAEIEQLWLGDLGWIIRLLRPLLLVLNPEAELSVLSEIKSEEELMQFLTSFDLSPVNHTQVLSILRKINGFIDLGHTLYESYGDKFQLDKWCKAIKKAGEIPVNNQQADEQFLFHMDSAQVPLRSVVREFLKQNKDVGAYPDLIKQMEALVIPEKYKDLYWEVTFQQTMVVVKSLLVLWRVPPSIIAVITAAQDVEELVTNLENLGFDPSVDPFEIMTANRASCLKILQKVQKTGIIWCLQNSVSFSFWERNETDFLECVDDSLKKEGYFDLWNDSKIFTEIKNLPMRKE